MSPTIARAARLLEAEGFCVIAENERGDSLYLAPPGSPWRLRLSNHARTPKQRRRRTDVLTSLVLDGPRSDDALGLAVREAVRSFHAALALRSREAEGSGDP